MTRKIVTNIALSLDGRYSRTNPLDNAWLLPYAISETARDHLAALHEHATTALLGRVNAEGFLGFWPTVIGAEGVDPRDEAFAKWLVESEKVVLSSTLEEAPWERTVVWDKPTAQAAAELKAAEGGDILVLASVSVIKALLAADAVDRLSITLFPVMLGEGPRLFDGDLPDGDWKPVRQEVGEDGTVALMYDRVR